jgi:hypothetical protein
MSIADPLSVLKMELTQYLVPQVIDLLTASSAGVPWTLSWPGMGPATRARP